MNNATVIYKNADLMDTHAANQLKWVPIDRKALILLGIDRSATYSRLLLWGWGSKNFNLASG